MTHPVNDKYTDKQLAEAMNNFLPILYKSYRDKAGPFAITHALALIVRINELEGQKALGAVQFQAFWDMCQEDAVKTMRKLNA